MLVFSPTSEKKIYLPPIVCYDTLLLYDLKNRLMCKLFFQFAILVSIMATSCMSEPEYGKPVVEPAIVLKDAPGFVKYYYPVMNLEEDFIALDMDSKPMDKTVFFEALLMGTYLPLKQQTKTNIYYRLYKMPDNVSENISATIKSKAHYAYRHHKMVGKPIPDFNFTDIDGNKYDSINIKGKVVVLKFWFIGCAPCVAEMPDLNTLVTKYKNDSILFLSLAFDKKERIQKFLATNLFNYKVVSGQKNYIVNTLNVQIYPTHIIINKEGLVIKVVNKFKDLEIALQKHILK